MPCFCKKTSLAPFKTPFTPPSRLVNLTPLNIPPQIKASLRAYLKPLVFPLIRPAFLNPYTPEGGGRLTVDQPFFPMAQPGDVIWKYPTCPPAKFAVSTLRESSCWWSLDEGLPPKEGPLKVVLVVVNVATKTIVMFIYNVVYLT